MHLLIYFPGKISFEARDPGLLVSLGTTDNSWSFAREDEELRADRARHAAEGDGVRGNTVNRLA